MKQAAEPKNIQTEIVNLQRELRQLKIESAAIIGRIETAESKLTKIVARAQQTDRTQLERKATLEEYRSLAGSKVRVVNPKSLEEITGTVLKVGSLYVSIILPNGKRLRRIANSLRLIQDEE